MGFLKFLFIKKKKKKKNWVQIFTLCGKKKKS